MARRTIAALCLMVVALLASGCFRVQQYVDLSDGKSAVMTTVLMSEKSYSGAEQESAR